MDPHWGGEWPRGVLCAVPHVSVSRHATQGLLLFSLHCIKAGSWLSRVFVKQEPTRWLTPGLTSHADMLEVSGRITTSTPSIGAGKRLWRGTRCVRV